MFAKSRWIIVIAFVLVLIVSMLVVFIQASRNNVVSIFSDIEECALLRNNEIDYNLKDEYLRELDFKKSYTAVINYNSIKFQIFAYEFKTVDTAKKYYTNSCNKEKELDKDYSYNFSSGMFESKGIVMNGKNLYRIKCDSAKIDDVKNYLSSVFSLKYVNGEGFINTEEQLA